MAEDEVSVKRGLSLDKNVMCGWMLGDLSSNELEIVMCGANTDSA